VRVQGEGAAREVAQAIALLNEFHRRACAEGRAHEGLDAIIVGRGGGSTEDLWAFNEEEVARAIRASLVPVITGVGHETDFTIADFAADVRAATPTAAAELVAAREDEVAARVEGLTRDMAVAFRLRLGDARVRVQDAAMSYGFDDVRSRLRSATARAGDASSVLERISTQRLVRERRRLDALTCRLSPASVSRRASRTRLRLAALRTGTETTVRARLEEARSRLAVAAAALDALSPLAVLQRGYALAEGEGGRLLRAAPSVAVGERVRVRLAEGALRCRVEEVEGV
ncbi:MAG TPA: exodeoxyribonuclease VII large subunit, partial [Pyrinomonadaceae bacterium]